MERRRSDPEFDAQIRKRAAERKRRERLRKKSGVRENELLPEAELNLRVVQDDFEGETGDEGQQIRRRVPKRKSGSLENPKLSPIESDVEPSNRQVTWRARGEEVRRKNRKEKNNEIKYLTKKLHEKDMEIEDLRKREAKDTSGDDWVKKVYNQMNSDGKRHFREAFYTASPEIERGTITRLRKNTGLNFSNPPSKNEQVKSETKLRIEAFAEQNTIQVPDKKKVSRGIRYRTSSLLSLYEAFECQNPNMCTYATFCKYWPRNFIKPKASDLGTCLCIICQNAELKMEGLKSEIGAEHSLETVVENARRNDFEAENALKAALEELVENESKKIVGYSRWEKVKQAELSKNTGRAKSDKIMRQSKLEPLDKLAESMLIEYQEYKQHLERNSTMRREIKSVVVETESDENLGVIHCDWAEQHQLSEVGEVQSAYFAGRFSYEIHTAFIYTKDGNHGAASISTAADHRAEAVHAAVKSEIVKLKDLGKTSIVVVSDSPISQYRNSKNVFLMKTLAEELGISIRLLFTECGHGKSPCDGVGGNIKTEVENALLRRHGERDLRTIHSAEDVKQVIENETNLSYRIKVHTASEIEEIRGKLPKLGPLTKALKIHEIMITSGGQVRSKNLPSDVFYENVKLKESRRIRRVDQHDDDNV